VVDVYASVKIVICIKLFLQSKRGNNLVTIIKNCSKKVYIIFLKAKH